MPLLFMIKCSTAFLIKKIGASYNDFLKHFLEIKILKNTIK